MTETEWLACDDPERMLELLRKRLDARLRRFAVECCRRIRSQITETEFRAAADAGEAFADDPRNERSTIRIMALAAIAAWRHRRRYATAANRHQLCAADAAIATCASTDWNAAIGAMRNAAGAANRTEVDLLDPVELQFQAGILRCIFGPFLFRSLRFDRSWTTHTVMSIAGTIFSDHAFHHLPILADALEDAGCDEAAILDHCRSGSIHVRGCWVVNLILSKP